MEGASPELEPQATNRSPNPFTPLLRHFSLPASTVPALFCMCGQGTTLGTNRRGLSNPRSCCTRAMVRGDLCPLRGDLCPLRGDLCPLHPPALGCSFFGCHGAPGPSAHSTAPVHAPPAKSPLVPGHFMPSQCQALVTASRFASPPRKKLRNASPGAFLEARRCCCSEPLAPASLRLVLKSKAGQTARAPCQTDGQHPMPKPCIFSRIFCV